MRGVKIIDQMVRNTLAEEGDQSSAAYVGLRKIKPKALNLSTPQTQTRIQKKNRETIQNAALEVFSTEGFRGATLDQIAATAGLSKPNLLYYFSSKEAIYTELLSGLLETWLDPLRDIDPDGDPITEIVGYVTRKLQMSRDYPRESRLFANEIVQGAPRILDQIEGPLRALVNESSAVFQKWMDAGQLAKTDPRHLIFSIWATTQHYADFNTQIRGILRAEDDGYMDDANAFLTAFYKRALQPDPH